MRIGARPGRTREPSSRDEGPPRGACSVRAEGAAQPRNAVRGENWRGGVLSTTATKASKATALMEELDRLDTSERLDDLEIRRLVHDAEALMASDPVGAHMVLGGVAGIEGDATRARSSAQQLRQRAGAGRRIRRSASSHHGGTPTCP